MNDNKSIAIKIKHARKTAKFTQEDLSDITGITAHHIGQLERGVILSPRTDTIQRISLATGMDIAWFVRDVNFITDSERTHIENCRQYR